MSRPSTFFQLLHDVGGAVWFGGSLMGAVGLNGAAAAADDPAERPRLASVGWAKWSPVAFVGIGAHALGGVGLLLANRDRVAGQAGVRSNTIIKTVVTLAGFAATAWSGALGAKIARAGHVGAIGATEPSASTPPDIAEAQKQLKALQWVIPALSGTVVGLGAQQSQQQRPEKMAEGRVEMLKSKLSR